MDEVFYNRSLPMELTQLLGIFLTGLLAGGLSCMAVQGGLLAATVAQRSTDAKALADKHELHLKQKAVGGNAKPILVFLIAKLIAYTVLGFFLGWIGSAFQFSSQVQITLQFAVGIFMLGTALHLLNVHPIFRYFLIQPPHFLARRIRQETKSKSIFAPAVLGAFTVFIPCGTTQAMMALSIASGNPVWGATILFAFVLGTSPIFFLLGYFTSRMAQSTKAVFTRSAAFILLSLAVFNLNNAVALTGSPLTLDTMARNVWCVFSYCHELQNIPPPSNDVRITIGADGYAPRNFSVRAGEPVTVSLVNKDSNNCAQAFTIPQLGINKVVPMGSSQTVSFTAPATPGQLTFMCNMGMYRGVINVI